MDYFTCYPDTDDRGRPLIYFGTNADHLSPAGARMRSHAHGPKAIAGYAVSWLAGPTCAETGEPVDSFFNTEDVDELRP